MRVEHNPIPPAAAGSSAAAQTPGRGPAGPSFDDVLARAGTDLTLSRHAQKRVDRRELNLDASHMKRLDSAIASASAKGARNSVVMIDDLAMVVDINDRTVVTAMQRQGGSEPKVFTNVDSVVIA